jgi:lipoprotein-anchoring transpeptidase ErfK/SrfK
VEVNLSKQHLWMYKKGKVVLESDVVSGTSGAHATPDGAYFILDKARNVVLRGPQVKTKAKKDKKGKVIKPAKTEYEWESPVSYWMPLTYEGIGLHDASWRGAFGGSIWTYNGSHGCINLPVSFAPKLYDKVKVGTPVAVYY